MPWTLNMILDHADELADRFEAFDPSEADEIPVDEYLLRRAIRTNPADEARHVEAVKAARESGMSWDRIGEILGISGSESEQWYHTATKRLDQSGIGPL